MTPREQDELITFFQLVLPALSPQFSMMQLLAGVIVKADIFGPWALFGQLADALGQRRLLRQVSDRKMLDKLFYTAGSAECVHQFVRHFRGRKLIA